jgi:hypothetical protein
VLLSYRRLPGADEPQRGHDGERQQQAVEQALRTRWVSQRPIATPANTAGTSIRLSVSVSVRIRPSHTLNGTFTRFTMKKNHAIVPTSSNFGSDTDRA